MSKLRTCSLSVAIFLLVLSNMILAGAMLGPQPSSSRQDASQSTSANTPILSQLGLRGQASSAGIVDVSTLPFSSGSNGKLWSTFQSPNIGSQPSSSPKSSPATLATTSSSTIALSGGFDGLNMT